MSLSKKYVPVDFTDSKTPHDRVLIVEDKRFYVYAGHLSFHSEFFRTLFYSDFKEKLQDEIKIEQLSAEDFHSFLKTLDPCTPFTITENNYLVIMACAHRFLAPCTLAMCEKFTIDNFETLDKVDLLKMAFEYNWDDLKSMLASYLTRTTDQQCPNRVKGFHCICRWCDSKPTGVLLNSDHFLAKKYEKMAHLPHEIHHFVLQTLLKAAKFMEPYNMQEVD